MNFLFKFWCILPAGIWEQPPLPNHQGPAMWAHVAGFELVTYIGIDALSPQKKLFMFLNTNAVTAVNTAPFPTTSATSATTTNTNTTATDTTTTNNDIKQLNKEKEKQLSKEEKKRGWGGWLIFMGG